MLAMNEAMMSTTAKRKRVEDRDNDDVVWEDFHELAHLYPEFAREWSEVRQQKHKSLAAAASPAFQVALTRALLHLRFGLYLPSLPNDRLCPPVPNRWAYVRWIQRTLLPMIHSRSDHFDTTCEPVNRGMDIGTGASCIYSLMHVKTNQACSMVATEVDSMSTKSAVANARANLLDSKIQVVLVPPTPIQNGEMMEEDNGDAQISIGNLDGPISCAMKRPELTSVRSSSSGPVWFDFCMTNPPFFDHLEGSTRRVDDRDPTPMTSWEGLYPGGEEGFILDMARDSLRWRDRFCWYTAMCGKKTSFVRLRQILKHLLGAGHIQTLEFGPGHMTRWFVAWTFQRPSIRSPAAKFMGKGAEFVVKLTNTNENGVVDEVVSRICEYCRTAPGTGLISNVRSRFGGEATVEIREKDMEPVFNHVDEPETLPGRLIDGVERDWDAANFLPTEGHFIVDVSVSVAPGQVTPKDTVIVRMACFQHSAHGRASIERIRKNLEKEVCRTSRKWRRVLKRQAEDASTAMEVE